MKCSLLEYYVILLLVHLHGFHISTGEKFTLGYLSGSQRRPGDFEYTRPGEFNDKLP